MEYLVLGESSKEQLRKIIDKGQMNPITELWAFNLKRPVFSADWKKTQQSCQHGIVDDWKFVIFQFSVIHNALRLW